MQTLVTCAIDAHMHGACALCKSHMSKYSSGLAFMQADLTLAKITSSHFWVLNVKNAN